jgi:hypothetical protein
LLFLGAAMDVEPMEKQTVNLEDDSNGSGHGIPNDGFDSDQGCDDPLHSVAESTVADEDVVGTQADHHPQNSRNQTVGVGGVVLDPQINLTITQIGLRQLLGRKAQPRPKPLLQVACKGCLRTTFDHDEFVKGDYMECLGSQPVQCSFQWHSLIVACWLVRTIVMLWGALQAGIVNIDNVTM